MKSHLEMRNPPQAKRFATILAGMLLVVGGFGCDTSPPGAGFTNEPRPESAEEKPASRTDFPLPNSSTSIAEDVSPMSQAEPTPDESPQIEPADSIKPGR